ncbi:MAG: hypothetical protein MHM6MM_004685 [Cercozoa sp. M6MM]
MSGDVFLALCPLVINSESLDETATQNSMLCEDPRGVGTPAPPVVVDSVTCADGSTTCVALLDAVNSAQFRLFACVDATVFDLTTVDSGTTPCKGSLLEAADIATCVNTFGESTITGVATTAACNHWNNNNTSHNTSHNNSNYWSNDNWNNDNWNSDNWNSDNWNSDNWNSDNWNSDNWNNDN